MPRFTRRVLVANRAVIARRIVRSCQELGLETAVAVTPSAPEHAWIFQADQVVLMPDSPDHLSLR